MTDTPPGWQAFLHLDDDALLAQCHVDRFRASGPGGQHRNVTDSAVRLRHRPTGVEVIANESRSQHENRARALRRLRLAIALASRAPVALDVYTSSDLLSGAVQGGRIRINPRSDRFPAVTAEVFDVLEATGWRVADAALALGLSTNALGRFLESDPALWRTASGRRQALGLPPLRPRG